MKYIKILIQLLLLIAIIMALGPTKAISQSTPLPPQAAVPEGNFFTTAVFVSTGLYVLWLKRRRND